MATGFHYRKEQMAEVTMVARVEEITHEQAKTMVELTEGEFSVGAIEEFRSYRSIAHVIFTVKKPYVRGAAMEREQRSFIIDQKGGYYRLPERERA